MRTILKLLLNLLHHCFYFMFWFFDCEACGIFTPWPGVEPISPALEGDALTTGPTREVPGISFSYFLYHITGGRRTLCVRVCVCVCVCVWLSHFSRVWLSVTLWTSPTRLLVSGILQARILEQFDISFSRGSSQPRDLQMGSLPLSNLGVPYTYVCAYTHKRLHLSIILIHVLF